MQEFVGKAILFDMDGVLVDSTACVERHWHAWAERHGLDGAHILTISHGQRALDTMRVVASSLDLDLEQEALLFEQGQARDLDGIVPLPGARELVTALPPACWAIVTSATLPMAMARLKATGLPIPRTFVTAEEVRQGKPHPEGYLKAASLLQVPPAACLVIEDAPSGIRAARAGHIPVLALTTTFPADHLQEADFVLTGLDALRLTVLDELAEYGPGFTLRIGFTQE